MMSEIDRLPSFSNLCGLTPPCDAPYVLHDVGCALMTFE
ncbi:Hypothetical protein, putative [Bodo saltans]|uniref:Uncharacterized protein n=1 Tax=Bodo saltans TaxID=75058 RepID=A0A0S4JAF2_BODSA|nr:Hypothetical protein, putative [Bodo saltans]|eukprot:CUG87099.1 Hypothetical protein, putative [Bodo saltans]